MKATKQLHDLGQSLWLDNITRDILDNGTLRPCSVKEGETVLLPEYGGNKVTLGDNQDYFLYRDDDIMGTLSDPTK